MKYAKWNERTINIERLERSEFQRLYEAAKKGDVYCVGCQKNVFLYLGIQHPPHFFHQYPNENSSCIHQKANIFVEANVTKEKEYVEKGGFRLPKGRMIQEDVREDITTFKTSRKAVIQKPIQLHRVHSTPSDIIKLDQEQQKAVEIIEGPVLVLAGAGSGKTRVLASRTVHMIKKGIDPKELMLVTFTQKAAQEMKERITLYLKQENIAANLPLTGTFHSIFYRILCHHNPSFLEKSSLIKWDWQKEQYILPKLKELGIEEKEFAFDQALQQISYWKNMMITPKDIKSKDKWEEQTKEIYEHYEMVKKEQKTFDFDDMLIKAYELLKENPTILSKYQKRFRYFFIDEFQDINPVQYELMKMLSDHTKNVFAVGDDDQAIYSFRGSDPTIILNFKKDYPTANVIQLKMNYRSSREIVSCAQDVISKNKTRYKKEIIAQFSTEDKPIFFFPYDEEEEATMIVNDMKEQIQKGKSPNDFAILYRTHSMARAIFERLNESSIPFQVEKDFESFYEKKMIKSILSFLRLSINPDDPYVVSDLLSALFIKQSALNDLKALAILEDCSFIEALPKLKGLQPFQVTKLKKVKRILPTLKDMKPIHALDIIEKDLGFLDFVKKRGHEGNKLEKGSDEIRDLKVAARKFKTVQEFLEHVDHMVAKSKEMKNQPLKRGVQLMTIHRAKGLEFDHVYILSCVDGGIPHDYALEQLREGENTFLEEERRLMYVAITRAKHFVALSLLETRRGKTANPSRFIRHMIENNENKNK